MFKMKYLKLELKTILIGTIKSKPISRGLVLLKGKTQNKENQSLSIGFCLRRSSYK